MSDYALTPHSLMLNAEDTPGEASPASSVTINAQPGAHSINGAGQTSTHHPQGVNTADFTGTGADGILSTARTRTGSPLMGPVGPTDVVLIEGSECQVQIAEQLGILKRDAQGNYTEVTGAVDALKAEHGKKEEQAPDDAGEALPDAAVEADLGNLCGTVSAGLQVAAMMQAIETGQVNPSIINAAASEARIEPGVMDARVQNVLASFSNQFETTVHSYGSDNPQEFYEWARQNRKPQMDKAMQTHGMERSTKAYEPIYQEYVADIATREPQRVLNAEFGSGITARLDDRKNVLLKIPGHGEMPYAVALRTGLIKVRGA